MLPVNSITKQVIRGLRPNTKAYYNSLNLQNVEYISYFIYKHAHVNAARMGQYSQRVTESITEYIKVQFGQEVALCGLRRKVNRNREVPT